MIVIDIISLLVLAALSASNVYRARLISRLVAALDHHARLLNRNSRLLEGDDDDEPEDEDEDEPSDAHAMVPAPLNRRCDRRYDSEFPAPVVDEGDGTATRAALIEAAERAVLEEEEDDGVYDHITAWGVSAGWSGDVLWFDGSGWIKDRARALRHDTRENARAYLSKMTREGIGRHGYQAFVRPIVTRD